MGCCMEPTNEPKYSVHQQPMYVHAEQLNEKDQIIVQLKFLRDDLFAKQQALYYQEQKSEQEIRLHLQNKKKSRAKFALQRKKLYDKYLSQIEQKYMFIQQQIIQVESMILDQNLTQVMQSTNQFLKDIQTAINLDTFSDAMQVNKNLEEQEELFEQLFDKYNVGDVNQEYARYEAEVFQNQANLPLQQSNQLKFVQQPQIIQQPQRYVMLN